jgi:transcriptional regulator with GAF, ATPase, and Fis domain
MMNQVRSDEFANQQQFIMRLGQDIASIKNREQLDSLINGCLKEKFGFQHATIFVLKNDGREISNFLKDYGELENRDQFSEVIFTGKIPFDHKINTLQIQQHQQMVDFDELVLSCNVEPYLADACNAEAYTFPLLQGSSAIGVWIILFKKGNAAHFEAKALCQMIAAQLTFAVIAIKTQEEIESRNQEREIIQSLNTDFATIREKKDLLRIIHYKLKSLFNFSHHWVATVNDDELTMSTFMQDTESRTKFHPKYKHVTYARYPIADQVFNKVILAADPLVFDLDQLTAREAIPEYLQINYESGIRKVVMQSLEIAGRFIGVWAICLGEKDEMKDTYINLIKDIASQFSIAVGNIIANEIIQAREAERELLLKLSYDITSIKDKKGLLRIIQTNLKKLFPFRHIVIMVLNDEDHTHDIFLSTDLAFTRENLAQYSKESTRFEYDAQQPACLQYLYNSGVRKKIGIALRDDNRNIGVLYINPEENSDYSDHQLEIVKGVSYQLSTAVSNILANEQILKRDSERDLLLSLSIDIASVRSNGELLKVISQRLKYLLKFSHTIVATINEDSTVSRFLLDPEARSTSHPGYKEAVCMRYPIQDDIFDRSILTPEPLLFNLQELMDSTNGDIPLYLKINYESGLKNAVVVRFSKGEQAFGFWILLFDHEVVFDTAKQNLIKGLSHQISVAVSNLTANEKINKQLEEINKYKQQLEEEKIYLKEEIETTQNYSDIIGESPLIRKTFKLVSQVASSDSTVLILGETGTGKELIARAIHNDSPRKDKLMVKVNCAALPPNLIESELFGHERGSFTGATEQRLGKFELANNSTLFLDEIGEMPLDLQVKLLRVLQEKEIERVGGRKTIKVNVRIVAATNRDLEKEVAEGRFRSDLYYRLNIFPIALPPLRERREDIPLLAAYFIQRFAKKAGRQITTFGNRALQDMIQYSWPGNIRELEHLIERSVLLSSGDTIKQIHLPSSKPVAQTTGPDEVVLKTIDENERHHILRILKFCGGKIAGEGGAAQILDVPPGTLYSKLKRLGIKREHSF